MSTPAPDAEQPEEQPPEEIPTEEPKPEEPKPEKPKPEEPKPEKPKPEEPKPEKPKPEEPKPEKPKPEEPKPEEPKPEEPKPEEPKPEEPKPEEPKPEEPKPEEPKPEASWWRPEVGASWHLQLTGRLDTTLDVDAYDIDLADTPAATIRALRDRGVRVICYFSAGSAEDWRADARDLPAKAVGREMQGWAGERWLDVRDPGVRDVMRARLDRAREKGCDAVDPDNVDGYTHNTGFNITAADQLDYNRFLAREAHARGLAIGLKNDVDQVKQLVDDFDFTVNEECLLYRECDRLSPFIEQGKPVFHVEYGDAAMRDRICPGAIERGFSTLVMTLDLNGPRLACGETR